MQCPKCGKTIPDSWKKHFECGWNKIEGQPDEEAKARLVLDNKEIFNLAFNKACDYVIVNKLNLQSSDTPKVLNTAFNLFWELGTTKQQDLIGE